MINFLALFIPFNEPFFDEVGSLFDPLKKYKKYAQPPCLQQRIEAEQPVPLDKFENIGAAVAHILNKGNVQPEKEIDGVGEAEVRVQVGEVALVRLGQDEVNAVGVVEAGPGQVAAQVNKGAAGPHVGPVASEKCEKKLLRETSCRALITRFKRSGFLCNAPSISHRRSEEWDIF